MMDQDREAFTRLAQDAVDANSAAALRKACKRLVVLCWLHMTPGDRWSFWDRTAPNTLDFTPPEPGEAVPDSDWAFIRRRWHEVVPRIADEKSRTFAQDVNKRRKFSNWVPTEGQMKWIKQIWKDYGTDEPEVSVVEDD